MDKASSRLRPSSSQLLSRRHWRWLRRLLPGSTWARAYAVRERAAFPKLAHQTIALLYGVQPEAQTSLPSTPSLREILADHAGVNADQLISAWRKYKAVGKEECGYHRIYSGVLANLSRHDPVRVMEVGIFDGGSHRAWRDVIRNAEVYGIDIDPESLFSEERITTARADQLDVREMSRVVNEFPENQWELVVDDGWHQPEAGLKTIQVLLPRLAVGGFYVVEDIDAKHYGRLWRTFVKALPRWIEAELITVDRVPELGKYGYEVLVMRRQG